MMVDISEEVELDLGLSIGGSFRRSKPLKPVEGDDFEHSGRNDKASEPDLREIQTASLRSNSLPAVIPANDADSKTKREIQALRRQEAIKKQREKRCRSVRGDSSLPDSAPSRASESRVMISQDEEGERASKKEKVAESNAVQNNDATNPIIYPGQLPYAPVHFVPYTRGFLFPCANFTPCWTTPIGGVGWPEKGAFRPFAAHPSFALNVVSQKTYEVVTKTTSDHDSPECTSSTISDRQSHSSEGDGSKDTITNSSGQRSPEQSQPNGSSKPKDCYHNNKLQSEAQSQPTQTTTEEQRPAKASKPCPTGPNTNISNQTTPVGLGKPPRPQCNKNNKTNNGVVSTETKVTASFPQMPYVSTRGDGPYGKTVTGLLYRYKKSEDVCIVCVCHGSTFSPAEFVQHAGGTDVSNPLRHITVMSHDF